MCLTRSLCADGIHSTYTYMKNVKNNIALSKPCNPTPRDGDSLRSRDLKKIYNRYNTRTWPTTVAVAATTTGKWNNSYKIITLLHARARGSGIYKNIIIIMFCSSSSKRHAAYTYIIILVVFRGD